jgi:hypothetical protein
MTVKELTGRDKLFLKLIDAQSKRITKLEMKLHEAMYRRAGRQLK